MIRLQNITKVYPTKAKMNVIALSNVSIELGDRGLVFYIGCIWKRKNDAVNYY